MCLKQSEWHTRNWVIVTLVLNHLLPREAAPLLLADHQGRHGAPTASLWTLKTHCPVLSHLLRHGCMRLAAPPTTHTHTHSRPISLTDRSADFLKAAANYQMQLRPSPPPQLQHPSECVCECVFQCYPAKWLSDHDGWIFLLFFSYVCLYQVKHSFIFLFRLQLLEHLCELLMGLYCFCLTNALHIQFPDSRHTWVQSGLLLALVVQL